MHKTLDLLNYINIALMSSFPKLNSNQILINQLARKLTSDRAQIYLIIVRSIWAWSEIPT